MFQKQDLDDMKIDVERALKAALYSMDYYILRNLLEVSKEAKSAYQKQDYRSALYLTNKGFWDIGIYIKNKLTSYTRVTPEFFENIAYNIKHYFKIDSSLAFSPENLKRCFKLVELVNESWFNKVAHRISWQNIAEAIDQSTTFSEFKNFFDT